MIHSETKRHNWLTYIMFKNLGKTHPERILQIMIKGLIGMCQHMETNPLLSTSYDISCCVFLLKYP